MGYLALEVLLAVVADVEALTDAALAAESSVGAAPVPVQQPGSARSGEDGYKRLLSVTVQPLWPYTCQLCSQPLHPCTGAG